LGGGVETLLAPYVPHTDEMVAQVENILLSLGRFQVGDAVVIVAGSPPGTPGSTNALRVWRLGDELPKSPAGSVRGGRGRDGRAAAAWVAWAAPLGRAGEGGRRCGGAGGARRG